MRSCAERGRKAKFVLLSPQLSGFIVHQESAENRADPAVFQGENKEKDPDEVMRDVLEAQQAMRAVLDANVIASAVISARGNAAVILSRWEEEHFDLVVSIRF